MGAEIFKKPSVAASVAVFDASRGMFLMVVRMHPPFAGKMAFPGGYMDVDQEDIYDTAVRELAEETGFIAQRSQLKLLDIRSLPSRDPRGHVIDVGFLCVTNATSQVALATEETLPQWVQWTALENADWAFDHREMFHAARTTLGLR